jgi:hypothetical protein
MKPDISEFSYGFALTNELIDRYKLRSAGAPEFPSLYKEGKSGGYDVKLAGILVFLQFKLSDCMVKSSAGESDLLKVPYYRMHLRPLRHSAQHDLLLALERDDENLVYYAAPEFHKPNELSLAFTARSVSEKTAFFCALGYRSLG